jgi:hypothetical protein
VATVDDQQLAAAALYVVIVARMVQLQVHTDVDMHCHVAEAEGAVLELL